MLSTLIPQSGVPTIETVFATGDPALVALAKSLLEDAKIEYFTRGHEIQDLIGIGGLGGLNYVTGPVEFVVAGKDAPTARELLAHLDDAVPDEPPEEEPGTQLGRSSRLGPRPTVRSSERRKKRTAFIE
jgi:hypothetical protein